MYMYNCTSTCTVQYLYVLLFVFREIGLMLNKTQREQDINNGIFTYHHLNVDVIKYTSLSLHMNNVHVYIHVYVHVRVCTCTCVCTCIIYLYMLYYIHLSGVQSVIGSNPT